MSVEVGEPCNNVKELNVAGTYVSEILVSVFFLPTLSFVPSSIFING